MDTPRELLNDLRDEINYVMADRAYDLELLSQLHDLLDQVDELSDAILAQRHGQCKLTVDNNDDQDLSKEEIMSLLEIELCGVMLGTTTVENGAFVRAEAEDLYRIMDIGRRGFYRMGGAILDRYDTFAKFDESGETPEAFLLPLTGIGQHG